MMPTARHIACLIVAALATPTPAQEAVEPPAEPSQNQVSDGEVLADLALWALKPVLDEAGQPVLDASGAPLEEFQPVIEGIALLPGDEIRYVVKLSNTGPEVEDLALALDLPAAALLLPETVTASVDADFDLGTSAEAGSREPLLVEVNSLSVPNPVWVEAPERFDLLLANIEHLAAGDAATLTYDLVVR